LGSFVFDCSGILTGFEGFTVVRQTSSSDGPVVLFCKKDGRCNSENIGETKKIETKFEDCIGVTTSTKVVNCWLRQNKRLLDNKLIDVGIGNGVDNNNDSFNYDKLQEDETNVIEDNIESVKGDNDDTVLEKRGNKIEMVWTRQNKVLRSDIAIAGWMCSPTNWTAIDITRETIETLQQDCTSNGLDMR
jgi:hypothetical protein